MWDLLFPKIGYKFSFFRFLDMVNTCKLHMILLLVILASFAHVHGQAFSFDSTFARQASSFDSIIQHKADYRLQIIYTRIDRDSNNFPHLTTYSYDADKYYYYCASMVKLPACALTLEKLNNLASYRVDMLDSLGVDSIGCTELNPQSMMLGTPYSCLGHYIKEMLMLSNNRAFNPVYDFLGQQYFQDRLHQIGIKSAVISNRFAACDTNANRFCDPLSLFDRHTHQLKYYQPCVNNERRQFYNRDLDPQVGIGYLGAADQLINQPKDFRFANYIALSDLHKFLTKVMLPETQQPAEKLNLTRRDYQYLYKCMGMFPRESAYPKLDSVHYPDRYMKYFMGNDTTSYIMPDNIRIFNKVGQAYGFMTDCSYVVDTLNKIEFFLSCAMYLNADGILNDGVYEYDQIGYPFFKNLFNTIYEQELIRPKRHLAHLRLPDFSDTLLVKPPPYWLKIDTTKSMPEIEAVLCSLADSMGALSLVAKLSAEEVFLKNMEFTLMLRRSLGYPFEYLRQKHISVLRADSSAVIFSWRENAYPYNDVVMQTHSYMGDIRVKKIESFDPDHRTNVINHLKHYNIFEVLNVESGPYYLLAGDADSMSGMIQAFELNDHAEPQRVQIFKVGKDTTDMIVAIKPPHRLSETRHSKTDAIAFHRAPPYSYYKHSYIIYTTGKMVSKKLKTRKIKLKFNGYLFK